MEWDLGKGMSGVEIYQLSKAHRVGGPRVKFLPVMLSMQQRVQAEAPNSVLHQLYYDVCEETRGQSDKGMYHSYIGFYAENLKRDASVLEIGVTPASLMLWRRYFSGDVVGIDIEDRAAVDGTLFIRADATKDVAALGAMEFDYIVDDASHLVADQVATFDLLYPRLKPGGSYFIEDIQNLKKFQEAFPRGIVHDMREERTFCPDNIIIEIKREVL